jgi:hypothetical protein
VTTFFLDLTFLREYVQNIVMECTHKNITSTFNKECVILF